MNQANSAAYEDDLVAEDATGATQRLTHKEFDEPALAWGPNESPLFIARVYVHPDNDEHGRMYSFVQRSSAAAIGAILETSVQEAWKTAARTRAHEAIRTPGIIALTVVLVGIAGLGGPIFEALPALPESPFEVLLEARSETEKVVELALSLRALDLDFADALADRIKDINEEIEADPEGLISADSLKAMINFFRDYPNVRKPRVFLTNAGKFRTVWEDSPNRRVSLDFGSRGQADYLIFAPNLGRPGEVERLSSSGSVKNAMAIAKDLGALRWVLHETG